MQENKMKSFRDSGLPPHCARNASFRGAMLGAPFQGIDTRNEESAWNASVQVYGFSRVITLFHVFSPRFSVARAWFLVGCEEMTVLFTFNIWNAESKSLRKLRFHKVLKGVRWNLNLAKVCRL
jgi:hypothetical protein